MTDDIDDSASPTVALRGEVEKLLETIAHLTPANRMAVLNIAAGFTLGDELPPAKFVAAADAFGETVRRVAVSRATANKLRSSAEKTH